MRCNSQVSYSWHLEIKDLETTRLKDEQDLRGLLQLKQQIYKLSKVSAPMTVWGICYTEQHV